MNKKTAFDQQPDGTGNRIKGDLHPDSRRGRGALSNRVGRFEKSERERIDDGWGSLEEGGKLKTEVRPDPSRSVISRNHSPDVPFDQSFNPYKGCEHGCIYCFARPTHAFLGLSPGLDFERLIFAKEDAAGLLAAELAKPSYRCQVIAFGANTDPYQPIEREQRITRQALEVCEAFNQPVAIITKGNLVLRDLDILERMARKNLVSVAISLTTLDRKLARTMEPRAATPMRRLDAIRELTLRGIKVSVLVAPIIPALNDHEIERIIGLAGRAGAVSCSYVLLRLPGEIRDLWLEWLESNYPDRAGRVMKLLQSMRGGKDYDHRWGKRMQGEGVYAKLLSDRFHLARQKYGLNRRSLRQLDTSLFSVPHQYRKSVSTLKQFDLFS
ncbi:PA0069 family radical SAM protein [Kiloniella laminariae]|uniref:PA0069 family radical SAM protein n=1 Tax=Kiloniella laminariae TaxID=454162 RepID=UPI000524882C|nr:PA0069 family radical SAM protein [Kiloniella laminariae]